jgi:hypothetical protein
MHQVIHECIQRMIKKVCQAYEQNDIQKVVLFEYRKNRKMPELNNLIYQHQNHQSYNQVNHKDFMDLMTYNHKHLHKFFYKFQYEPTF